MAAAHVAYPDWHDPPNSHPVYMLKITNTSIDIALPAFDRALFAYAKYHTRYFIIFSYEIYICFLILRCEGFSCPYHRFMARITRG
jgi:hypothetical protein